MMNRITISMMLLTAISALNAGDITRSVADLVSSPKVAASVSAVRSFCEQYAPVLKSRQAKRVGGIVGGLLALDCAYAAAQGKGLNETYLARSIQMLFYRIRDNKSTTLAPVEKPWIKIKPKNVGVDGQVFTLDQIDQMGLLGLHAYHGIGEIIDVGAPYFVKLPNGNYRLGILEERIPDTDIFTTRFNGSETVSVNARADVYLPNGAELRLDKNVHLIQLFQFQAGTDIRSSFDKNGKWDGYEYQVR